MVMVTCNIAADAVNYVDMLAMFDNGEDNIWRRLPTNTLTDGQIG